MSGVVVVVLSVVQFVSDVVFVRPGLMLMTITVDTVHFLSDMTVRFGLGLAKIAEHFPRRLSTLICGGNPFKNIAYPGGFTSLELLSMGQSSVDNVCC